MLKERTKAGLDAAREDGRIGGSRPKLSPQQQVEIRKMVSKAVADAGSCLRSTRIRVPFSENLHDSDGSEIGVVSAERTGAKCLAGRQGLEPRYADPDSAVLPLNDLPSRVPSV